MTFSEYEMMGTTTGGGGHVPQIVDEMPFEDYRSIRLLNNSLLSQMAISPAHFKLARDYPTERNSAALRFGTLAHCGVLEEESIFNRYERIPPFENKIKAKNPRATKAYKEQLAAFRETIAPKTAVAIDDFDRMLAVARAIGKYAPVFNGGTAESVFIWQDPDTGLWCKSRPDYLSFCGGLGTIYDFKTTRDCRDFGRSIANYGYDRQAAFYLRGCKALGVDASEFWFVIAETEPPYTVMAAPIDEATLADGEWQVQRLLRRVVECERANDWPAADSPRTFAKPAWAMHKQDVPRLTAGGKPL